MSTTNNDAIKLAEKASQLNFDKLIDFLTYYDNTENIAESLLLLHFELMTYILNDKDNCGVYAERNKAIYCLQELYESIKSMKDASVSELKITAR